MTPRAASRQVLAVTEALRVYPKHYDRKAGAGKGRQAAHDWARPRGVRGRRALDRRAGEAQMSPRTPLLCTLRGRALATAYVRAGDAAARRRDAPVPRPARFGCRPSPGW